MVNINLTMPHSWKLLVSTQSRKISHIICLALVSQLLTLLWTEGKHVKVGVIVSLASGH